MKITVEVSPEDLAAITEQVMKAAGPEAMSKIWMAIGDQIAAQMQAQMLSQMPDAFRPFFEMQSKPPPVKKKVTTLGIHVHRIYCPHRPAKAASL